MDRKLHGLGGSRPSPRQRAPHCPRPGCLGPRAFLRCEGGGLGCRRQPPPGVDTRLHPWGTVRPGPLGPTEGLAAACPLTWPCPDSDWGPQRGAHGPHERGAAAAGTGQADQPGSRREARPGRLRGPRWVPGWAWGIFAPRARPPAGMQGLAGRAVAGGPPWLGAPAYAGAMVRGAGSWALPQRATQEEKGPPRRWGA